MRKVKISFRSPSFATNNKVALIKDVRIYAALGLKEAKNVVDAIFDSLGYQTTIDHQFISAGASEFFRFEVITDVNGVAPLAVNKMQVQLKYSLDIAIEDRRFDVARKLIEALELI